MTLGFEIKGVNRVRNQLRFLAAMHPSKTDPIIRDHAKRQQRELRATPYPAKPADSTYIRKHFFGGIAGSFSAQAVKPGVWRVSNSRSYALYVIGQKGDQTKLHASNNWWRMKDVLEETLPELVKDLTVMLEKELARQSD